MVSGVLCDRKISLTGKVYKCVVRPTMMSSEIGSDESAEEIGCGRNEDVEMIVSCYKDGQN